MNSTGKPFGVSRFLLALLAAAVAAPLAVQAAPPAAAKPTAAPRPTLLFFMNPAGSPCQAQDGILKESRAQWEPLATLRYVRTDVPADREVFYQYGVRSLPNLILAGADGKEIHRFSPGIQSADAILSALREKPSR